MANVFTRKYKRPRTTTFTDFDLSETGPRIFPRVMSPTRRQNPHSVGLKYQSPYNKDNLTFGIWKPDFNSIQKRLPDMIRHTQVTNWTSGHHGPYISNYGKPPDIHYTLTSTSRSSYQDPLVVFPTLQDKSRVMTRFGHTPCNIGRGIVPNLLPPLVQSHRDK
ncbi:uncharacterized protein LOC117109374 [Anneissia japonica]|uniref:uncharacterized protein LOC117109374 n=1 Tax=Anneissia japonica TaxID=1529436 RepID=UPI0014258718|nr:uncharacterized protein LOC117109374 [Anneissia japonica]